MTTLTIEQQLKLWQDVETVLSSIPENMRSRYHTDYLNEVSGRVYECQQDLNHLNRRK